MVISLIFVHHLPPHPALGGSVMLNLLFFLNFIVVVMVSFIRPARYKLKIRDSQ